jgi:GNAT superfamily N-acetyltransferase
MDSRPERFEIVEVAAVDTHPLRRTVLRTGTASDVVEFEGDDLASTFHLGATCDGELIAVSTWLERNHPDRPDLRGRQLRGMATAPSHRSCGVGAALLAAGIERCAGDGAQLVWARARVSALAFYRRHGFEPVGPGYVDPTTGLPHRDIIRFPD